MRWHLFAVLLLAPSAGARQLDVRCQRDVVADTAAMLGAVRSSVKGDVILFVGTCVVNETVPLLEGRGYIGEDRASSRIVQASGANLRALAASEAWLKGTPGPGTATRIAHLTFDGNSQANTNTHTLVLRAWLLNVYDLDILNSAEDGVRVTAFSADERSANQLGQSQVNNYFARLRIEGAGNIGFHVVDQMADLGITDSHLLDSRVLKTGGSAVLLGNAAGWQVRGVHVSEAGEHGIVGVRCSGSSFTDNLVEDFGHRAIRRSDTEYSQTAVDGWNRWGDRWFRRVWFGLGCYVQPDTSGGSITILADNKIYHDMRGIFTPTDGNASTEIMAMLGVADVVGPSAPSVPTGKVHVNGNTLGGGNRRWSVGEWYSVSPGKLLEVYSRSNDVFGVRRLITTDDAQVRVEPAPAGGLTPPSQLRRDPCCPLANPVDFGMPYTHGDFFSNNGASGPVYAFLGFDEQTNTLMHKVLARRQSHFSPSCFNYLSSPRNRNARRMEITLDKAPSICDMSERGAAACYLQTCDFSVVSVDALQPAAKAQFCEGEHVGSAPASRRQCEYFTLLRHPVDRLHSAYTQDCKGCKESGRQCDGNPEERPGLGPLTCPDMTIEAYARHFGSVYTRALAAKGHAAGPGALAPPDAPSPDAAAADRALSNMFVMLEEDLASDAPFAGLADWMDDTTSATLKGLAAPQLNPFAQPRLAHPEVSQEVRQAIADDIWLYERAVQRRRSAAA